MRLEGICGWKRVGPTGTGDTRSVHIMNRPVVLLTMRGAKTGGIRKVPLMRVEHDGVYAAVASQGGAPKHPQWYANVKADPHLTVQDGTESWPAVAREVSDAEREAMVRLLVDRARGVGAGDHAASVRRPAAGCAADARG